MPNIALLLKDEIARVARKELRNETEKLKKASTQHRSDIAALKRRVLALEQQLARFEKNAGKKSAAPPASDDTGRVRFSAKGFGSLRRKLGLSAAQMGALVAVSAQTIYNWETEKSSPRQSQMTAIVAARGMGKREALARLGELAQ